MMLQPILDSYLGRFQAAGEPILIAICNTDVPTKIVLEAYKKLPPIETMPEKEKEEMKQFINETFPNKSIEEKVIAAKVVYTIGTLI